MSIDEIRRNAPSGATHYALSEIQLSDNEIATYFKLDDGKYYEYFSHKFARYESGVCHKLIKPLY